MLELLGHLVRAQQEAERDHAKAHHQENAQHIDNV
jgi:hypothetical protein